MLQEVIAKAQANAETKAAMQTVTKSFREFKEEVNGTVLERTSLQIKRACLYERLYSSSFLYLSRKDSSNAPLWH